MSPAATSAQRPPVALYIHVPFCVSLCPYCDFVVIAGSAARGPRNRIGQFLDALMVELELRADALDAAFGPPGGGSGSRRRPPLESVYVGGGTPSLLPIDEVERVLGRVRQRFGLASDAEITIEANPGPDERGDPVALRRAGITRMSFGAQSFDDTELRKLGRRHRARHVQDAVAEARDAGIGSINVDLLYDIPDTDLATWMTTLDTALALEPDHLSLYALSLDDPVAEGLTGPEGDHLPTTKGARRWRDAVRPGQDEDRAAAQYHHASFVLGDAGFRGYEISNWARPGHESRHNLAYWRRLPHEALGPGAHAFDGVDRRWTAGRLDLYVAALGGSPATLPPGGVETLDDESATVEELILGMRLDTGVPLSLAHRPPLGDVFGWALAAELLTVTDQDRVVLTTRGRLLSNEIFARLV
jgi:putative oxygen-independent coproporphyrinogen III oxidase